MKTFVVGTGTYLPEKVVTNDDLSESLNLDSEQIYKSSGIRARRWAASKTRTSSLAASALEFALDDAGLNKEQIDYLLFGTMTPDRFIPGSSTAIQQSAGLQQIPCLDIRATCCNALYGLQLARSLVLSGTARHVAISLAEIQSAWLDLSAASGTTSMLFGDGASALIVSGQEQSASLEIIDVFIASDGAYIDDLGIRCPGTEFGMNRKHEDAGLEHESDYFPRMVGQSVILQASRKMVAACQLVLQRNNLSINDVRWLVPHQANANLLVHVARSLRFAADGIISLLEDYGNTSSASMGIALDSLRRSGRIQPGDHLLLPAFGAGFTWGAALCKA